MAALLLVLAFVGVLAVSLVGGLVLGNVVVALLAARLLRRRRIELVVPERYEVTAQDVPGGALALLFEYDLTAAGFASLGYLTGPAMYALWGYQQCWVDRGDPETCVAVTVRKLAQRSKPERVLSLATPATVHGRAVLVVTSNVVGLTRQDEGDILSAQLPGLPPARVIEAHRRRLGELAATPTDTFSDLAQVESFLRGIGTQALRRQVELGQLEQVSEGVGRLSWRRCLWGAAMAGPMARRLRARRVTAV